MPVQPDAKYDATVLVAELREAKPKPGNEHGTAYIFIKFQTDDGTVDGVIWLTENTVERATTDLVTLGAEAEKLKTWEYLNDIGAAIQGGRCNITTEENEYEGKKSVRVKWINAHRRAGAKTASRVAQLFGGTAAPEPVSNNRQSIDDSDVPF